MIHEMPSMENDYKKEQEIISKKIKAIDAKISSKIVDRKAEEERRNTPEIRRRVEMARMVFNEGIEMFQKGDMEFNEFIEDLFKVLKAIK